MRPVTATISGTNFIQLQTGLQHRDLLPEWTVEPLESRLVTRDSESPAYWFP